MGTITILPETTKNPISLIGRRAGICWGSDVESDSKNYKRGLACINSGHGRVLEFVNIETVIDGYSARVIREWYTHIGGSPTRLQASTRYINYNDFDYIIPNTIKTIKQENEYREAMRSIKESTVKLMELGVPKEDVANLLPLGMATKIVDKRNLRNVIDMSRQRMCNRAYWEFRQMFTDYINALGEISEEWEYVVETQMKPKCDVYGKCSEAKSCGRLSKKKETDTYDGDKKGIVEYGVKREDNDDG